jgi:hypothetical protein
MDLRKIAPLRPDKRKIYLSGSSNQIAAPEIEIMSALTFQQISYSHGMPAPEPAFHGNRGSISNILGKSAGSESTLRNPIFCLDNGVHLMEIKAVEQFRAKLREIERAVWIQTRSEALCCGVTMAQCHAILEIGDAGELNLKDLSARLGLDTSTLSRTVESLAYVCGVRL